VPKKLRQETSLWASNFFHRLITSFLIALALELGRAFTPAPTPRGPRTPVAPVTAPLFLRERYGKSAFPGGHGNTLLDGLADYWAVRKASQTVVQDQTVEPLPWHSRLPASSGVGGELVFFAAPLRFRSPSTYDFRRESPRIACTRHLGGNSGVRGARPENRSPMIQFPGPTLRVRHPLDSGLLLTPERARRWFRSAKARRRKGRLCRCHHGHKARGKSRDSGCDLTSNTAGRRSADSPLFERKK